MTAVPLLVRTPGTLDVSRPPRAVGWARVAGYLSDIGLVLLMVLALPALLAVGLALVELFAQAVIAITGWRT
jgi:hypothetical protein